MQKQDTQICRDSKSLGNFLITGEFHVETASQSPTQIMEGNRILKEYNKNVIMAHNVAFLDLTKKDSVFSIVFTPITHWVED